MSPLVWALPAFGVRNLWRNRTRACLTVAGGAIAIVAFVLIRTLLWSFTVGVEYAAKDRLGTRNKVSHTLPLPKRYVDTIRQVRGVGHVSFISWFGGKAPNFPNDSFSSFAADPESILQVYSEIGLAPDEVERWVADRRGAIVGDMLAQKLALRVGDKITLTGTTYSGDWEFTIDGIYRAKNRSLDRSQFIFHWDYLNDTLPERQRDRVGWIIARIDEPARSADISAAVDRIFDERDIQTTTMSERAINNSFLATFSAIFRALHIVSVIVLFILLLVLGNTIAMGVRERTSEYGVLRALGFSRRHIGVLVVGEALAVGVLAGVLGVALSYPIVELGMGRWLEENQGQFFPYFRVNAGAALSAVLLSALLATAAALLPARRAAHLPIADALRRVG